MQVRGQATGPVLARDVAAVAVGLERAGEEHRQGLARTGLARRPVETAGPVRPGRVQIPVIDRFGFHARNPVQRPRSIAGGGLIRPVEERLQEGCEHLVWAPSAGANRPRLEEEVGLEARCLDAVFACPGLDCGVNRSLRETVAAVPEQVHRAGLGRQFRNDFFGPSAA